MCTRRWIHSLCLTRQERRTWRKTEDDRWIELRKNIYSVWKMPTRGRLSKMKIVELVLVISCCEENTLSLWSQNLREKMSEQSDLIMLWICRWHGTLASVLTRLWHVESANACKSLAVAPIIASDSLENCIRKQHTVHPAWNHNASCAIAFRIRFAIFHFFSVFNFNAMRRSQ